MPFSEKDWKYLRALEATALERYCTRVLEESSAIIRDTSDSPYDRYLRLFYLLHERNAEMGTAFDDLRRSTALQRLAAMVGLGLLTEEELAGFNADVQETVRTLRDMFAPRRKPPAARDNDRERTCYVATGGSRYETSPVTHGDLFRGCRIRPARTARGGQRIRHGFLRSLVWIGTAGDGGVHELLRAGWLHSSTWRGARPLRDEILRSAPPRVWRVGGPLPGVERQSVIAALVARLARAPRLRGNRR